MQAYGNLANKAHCMSPDEIKQRDMAERAKIVRAQKKERLLAAQKEEQDKLQAEQEAQKKAERDAQEKAERRKQEQLEKEKEEEAERERKEEEERLQRKQDEEDREDEERRKKEEEEAERELARIAEQEREAILSLEAESQKQKQQEEEECARKREAATEQAIAQHLVDQTLAVHQKQWQAQMESKTAEYHHIRDALQISEEKYRHLETTFFDLSHKMEAVLKLTQELELKQQTQAREEANMSAADRIARQLNAGVIDITDEKYKGDPECEQAVKDRQMQLLREHNNLVQKNTAAQARIWLNILARGTEMLNRTVGKPFHSDGFHVRVNKALQDGEFKDALNKLAREKWAAEMLANPAGAIGSTFVNEFLTNHLEQVKELEQKGATGYRQQAQDVINKQLQTQQQQQQQGSQSNNSAAAFPQSNHTVGCKCGSCLQAYRRLVQEAERHVVGCMCGPCVETYKQLLQLPCDPLASSSPGVPNSSAQSSSSRVAPSAVEPPKPTREMELQAQLLRERTEKAELLEQLLRQKDAELQRVLQEHALKEQSLKAQQTLRDQQVQQTLREQQTLEQQKLQEQEILRQRALLQEQMLQRQEADRLGAEQADQRRLNKEHELLLQKAKTEEKKVRETTDVSQVCVDKDQARPLFSFQTSAPAVPEKNADLLFSSASVSSTSHPGVSPFVSPFASPFASAEPPVVFPSPDREVRAPSAPPLATLPTTPSVAQETPPAFVANIAGSAVQSDAAPFVYHFRGEEQDNGDVFEHKHERSSSLERSRNRESSNHYRSRTPHKHEPFVRVPQTIRTGVASEYASCSYATPEVVDPISQRSRAEFETTPRMRGVLEEDQLQRIQRYVEYAQPMLGLVPELIVTN